MKKIEEIQDISELHLDNRSVAIVTAHSHSPYTLIVAARRNELTRLAGIGKATAMRIAKKVDTAGFIMHEPAMSWGMRNLLAETFHVTLGSTEEYEARTIFTEQQRDQLFGVLEAIGDREAQILKLRFGLSGAEPMSLSEVGHVFGVTLERIRVIQARAHRKLRIPIRMKMLWGIFPEWSEFETIIPEQMKARDESIEEMQIRNLLDLSIRQHNSLIRGGIYTVGQLAQHTKADLKKMRNLSDRSIDQIANALAKVGYNLKVETDS